MHVYQVWSKRTISRNNTKIVPNMVVTVQVQSNNGPFENNRKAIVDAYQRQYGSKIKVDSNSDFNFKKIG